MIVAIAILHSSLCSLHDVLGSQTDLEVLGKLLADQRLKFRSPYFQTDVLLAHSPGPPLCHSRVTIYMLGLEPSLFA